ncbi:hypothetical protein Syun_004690 [Stephania yunnanensis]|uniref:Uncharacterized protein n=1 Tax=Stephania yunnanensis TaxID=152371 RepID=A0AAP0L4Y2_9MAGN
MEFIRKSGSTKHLSMNLSVLMIMLVLAYQLISPVHCRPIMSVNEKKNEIDVGCDKKSCEANYSGAGDHTTYLVGSVDKEYCKER